jgi:hypothetical protein
VASFALETVSDVNATLASSPTSVVLASFVASIVSSDASVVPCEAESDAALEAVADDEEGEGACVAWPASRCIPGTGGGGTSVVMPSLVSGSEAALEVVLVAEEESAFVEDGGDLPSEQPWLKPTTSRPELKARKRFGGRCIVVPSRKAV